MPNGIVKSPFDALLEVMENSYQGKIVLCASSRSALLLKRKVLQCIGAKAFMDTRITSTSELIANISREMGLESKVIGGLGREMLVSEILSELKGSLKEYPALDMRDYVKGISQAIAELIQSGVGEWSVGSGAFVGSKLWLLRQSFAQYTKKLKNNSAIDAKELPSKVFEAARVEKLKNYLKGKQIIFYCVQEDELAKAVSDSLNELGMKVMSIAPRERSFPSGLIMHRLYARQGRQLSREVARKCKLLINESGCGFSDICLVIPQSSGKEKELNRALEWAGIPCSDPLWEDLSDHPAASSLVSAMELLSLSNDKFDIFLYINAPYFGLEHFERPKHGEKGNRCTTWPNRGFAAKVESYLWQKSKPLYLSEWANIRKWNSHFRPIKPDDQLMNEVQSAFYTWAEVMEKYARKMNRKAKWSEHCDSLEEFFKEFYINRAQLCSEKTDPKNSSVELKALVGIQQVIDKIRSANQLMSDSSEPVDWAEFAATVQQAFKEKRLMLRGSSNSGVGIAEPKDIVGLDFKHVIFYEASEANFPKPWSTGWVLAEQDRKEIKGLKEKSVEERNALAKAHFMMAARAASETLWFAIPSIGEDEKPVNPSIWVEEVEEELSSTGIAVKEEHVKRRLPAPERQDLCVTVKELGLKKEDDKVSTTGEPWGKELLLQRNLEDEKRLAELSSIRFNDEYKWSPSMLNQYLKCGISIIPKYLDALREREEYEELPSAASTGNFLHGIAESILLKIAETKHQTDESAWGAVERLIQEKLTYENAAISASMPAELWQLYKGLYTRIMTGFAKSELLHMRQAGGIFANHITERDLTTGDECGKLTLGEIRASFKARVDRMDVTANGEAAIFDYKTGSIPKRSEDVQLEFYALIASQVLGYTPIATAYFPLSVKGCTRLDIEVGEYVEEFSASLGFKRYNRNNRSLLPHPLSAVHDGLDASSSRIAGLIAEIKAGSMLRMGPSNIESCKYCVRDAVCWKVKKTEKEED
ncbi:MAG TPA: PD-(D/E)XK nuclease family protein [Bacillota bacterium]|nr:PD-(D/E)XK nuclease family protein [Bacillota bacterium]